MKALLASVLLPILAFVLILGGATTYTMLEAFVFDREIGEVTVDRRPITEPVTTDGGFDTTVSGSSAETSGGSDDPVEPNEPEAVYPIIGDLYYKDANIEITIEETYYTNKNLVENKIFIVDIKLTDVSYLKTFVNTNSNGKVNKTTVSDMAEKNNAVFAINGDYFSYRERGYVIRNYIEWRSKARKRYDSFGDDALLILSDGSFRMIDENDVSFASLPADTYQCFSFGPRLIENGVIQVNWNSEVGQSAEANPRTAIGIVEPLHYKIVVAEGRLDRYSGKDGMKLYEMADVLASLGCTDAYNLDGGSSTTLYFNGRVLNETPSSERKVSDCIYINGLSYFEEDN